MGTPLHAGESYMLVIDRAWKDAYGRDLQEPFRKTFRVGPQDRRPPDPKAWKLSQPRAGTRTPFEIVFPEPMEHALAMRLIQVVGTDAAPLAGEIRLDAQETRWRFTPRDPWKPGRHSIRVETTLEDLAGNRIGRRSRWICSGRSAASGLGNGLAPVPGQVGSATGWLKFTSAVL